MFILKPLVFVVLASTNVIAQSSSAVPTGVAGLSPCIITCLTQASSSGTCSSFTDISCVCSSQAFQSAAAQCLTSSCSSSDQAAALQLQQTECGSASGSASSGASATSLATSSGSAASESGSSSTLTGSAASSAVSSAVSSISNAESSVASSASQAGSSIRSSLSSAASAASASASASRSTSASASGSAGFKVEIGKGGLVSALVGMLGAVAGALMVL
ncbi:hypothetical protein HETIRDRAFT_461384 [Heterobasidion irregulare TC 32-1]|uniref:CFEM domain-containing protein n=1 Tax=Heterobasidion irregulare (strain TC 32-1) TaxID=747525 RepID=W4JNG3_HETIT|nr:uncharacterized protein HETIRDRAFT_461384 [Heterobasidion irregulare TC 32-1]ETW74605.1 hypothetical protein HETIRDRAFT_461384 [Heterobasidion irregulare TC 32-1]